MSEQRIDTGADAATSTDADPGEGLGTSGPSADPRGGAGGDAEMPQPTADRPSGSAAEPGDTEGESYLKQTQANQNADTDLSGREPAASGPSSDSGNDSGRDSGRGSGGGNRAGGGAADPAGAGPHAGEISAEPSERRRQQDPGSVAEEFGDRAGTAPDDDIARPSI